MKYIEIKKCSECPHSTTLQGRKNGVACIPVCEKTGVHKGLPYIEKSYACVGTVADETDVIPNWCPLDDLIEEPCNHFWEYQGMGVVICTECNEMREDT